MTNLFSDVIDPSDCCGHRGASVYPPHPEFEQRLESVQLTRGSYFILYLASVAKPRQGRTRDRPWTLHAKDSAVPRLGLESISADKLESAGPFTVHSGLRISGATIGVGVAVHNDCSPFYGYGGWLPFAKTFLNFRSTNSVQFKMSINDSGQGNRFSSEPFPTTTAWFERHVIHYDRTR